MRASTGIAAAGAVALVMATGAHGSHHSRAHLLSAGASHLSGNEALARRMAAGAGWRGRQLHCLDQLWTRESAGTWNPTVTDPTSGAYGIPQAMPGSKMASAGTGWRTGAATQIRWGLGYIAIRYHTPCGAWAHEIAQGWY